MTTLLFFSSSYVERGSLCRCSGDGSADVRRWLCLRACSGRSPAATILPCLRATRLLVAVTVCSYVMLDAQFAGAMLHAVNQARRARQSRVTQSRWIFPADSISSEMADSRRARSSGESRMWS